MKYVVAAFFSDATEKAKIILDMLNDINGQQ